MTKYDTLKADLSKLLDVVTSYYNICADEIFIRNTEDIVDARYCLISILCEKYKDSDISSICGVSKSVVNKVRNAINSRCKNNSFLVDLKNVKSLFYSL